MQADGLCSDDKCASVDINNIPIEYPPTEEIMAEIYALKKEIQSNLAELDKMLRE